jgi:hypothetical protein
MCPREKKGLKIPNGSSESVNPRRTDNTMAKRKSTAAKPTMTVMMIKFAKFYSRGNKFCTLNLQLILEMWYELS